MTEKVCKCLQVALNCVSHLQILKLSEVKMLSERYLPTASGQVFCTVNLNMQEKLHYYIMLERLIHTRLGLVLDQHVLVFGTWVRGKKCSRQTF